MVKRNYKNPLSADGRRKSSAWTGSGTSRRELNRMYQASISGPLTVKRGRVDWDLLKADQRRRERRTRLPIDNPKEVVGWILSVREQLNFRISADDVRLLQRIMEDDELDLDEWRRVKLIRKRAQNATYRARETPQRRAERLKYNREWKANRFANETQEERRDRQFKESGYRRQLRLSKPPEWHARVSERMRNWYQSKRDAMSPDEIEAFNASRRIDTLSPTELEVRREYKRNWIAASRARETPAQHEARLARMRAARRARKAREENDVRPSKVSLFNRSSRQTGGGGSRHSRGGAGGGGKSQTGRGFATYNAAKRNRRVDRKTAPKGRANR